MSFKKIAAEVAELVTQKNEAYGNSFDKTGEILKLLTQGKPLQPEGFHSMLFVARVIDKLFRIMTDPTAFGEDPVKDIFGYALLELNRQQKQTPTVLGLDQRRADVREASIQAVTLLERVWRGEVVPFNDVTPVIQLLNEAGFFARTPPPEETPPSPTAPMRPAR